MLLDYLSSDAIEVQADATTWEAAIALAGNLLVTTGKCTPDYTHAMIDALREAGPYIVFAPGIALAHARPADGALELGISLVTLKTSVSFGSQANDPVALIFAFCSVDDHSHVALIATLARILDDADRCQRLTQARSTADVMQIFRDFEAGKGATS